MWKIISYSVMLVFAVLMVFIPCPANAQEITSVEAQGSCSYFTVTVTAEGLAEGCWDVKLDIPGEIYIDDAGDGEWRSTFYYADQALCYPDTDWAVLQLRLDSRESIVRGTARIRLDNTIREKDFEITQSCPPEPQPIPDFLLIVIVFGIVVFFGWTLTWWWKQGHEPVHKKSSKKK